MAHSFTKCLFHCVFSTKGRRALIPDDIQPRLWAYLGGVARTNQFTLLIAGGIADHAHVLLLLPATMPVAKAVQLIKAGSSKWLHDTFPTMGAFAWQEGYAAFTVGVSQLDDTMAYIKNQREHHRARGFDEEYRLFLERHGFDFDAGRALG